MSFKQCPNGHYYSSNLENCPYCGSMSRTATSESWYHPSEYIVDGRGHYYMLNSDGKTASFICWSKEAWDIYHNYEDLLFRDEEKPRCAIIDKEYEYYDTLRIKSKLSTIEIPKEITYNDHVYQVVRIKSGAFAFSKINVITIPDTVVSIEEKAFFRCDDLEELIIPDSVKELANRAISECRHLIDITWKGVTYANDICEPFLFPDEKDKYAIKVNNNGNLTNYAIEYTPEHISHLVPDEIFVFGSNLQGMHCSGAAKYAYEHFGAEWGKGVGLAGQTYAIPTMHGEVKQIKPYVDDFIDFAEARPQYRFLVTPIGCGIAGFNARQIAPLFFKAIHIPNIILPKGFYEVLLPLEESVIRNIINV